VAATEREATTALAALTGAALALPGLDAAAAYLDGRAHGDMRYAYYQESDGRMQVEVYHGGFVLPVTERLEFTFGLDRDTYSGATPSFSAPVTVLDQPKYKQRDDGIPAAEIMRADIVSAASGGTTAGGLTLLGGLNAYREFVDARPAAEAAYLAANPRPASPPSPPTLPGPVTLNFQGMTFSSIAGKSNLAPLADGGCAGLGTAGCYYESGMVVGIVDDPSNPIAHLHRNGGAGNRLLGYHSDSSGIYVRAQDGAAFSLNSLDFLAALGAGNPDAGSNDAWEILGFDTALNPTLAQGDGTNYATRVAHQTVVNGFNGTLTLDPAFQNINAFWIHYKGYPATPVDGKDFSMQLDNVALSGVAPNTAETPAQIAWARQLERHVAIAQYRAVLDQLVPRGTPTVQRFETQPRETRTMPAVGVKYAFDDSTLAVNGGLSDEPDFRSSFGTIEWRREFNQRLTTLGLGYSFTHNTITRAGAGHATHHASDPEHNPTDYPELDATSVYHGLSLGLSQVLDHNTLLQLSLNYTHQSGYLSNPYKFVYVRGEITAEEYYALWQAGPGDVDWRAVTALEVVGIELFREVRPDLRQQLALSAHLNRHLAALDATAQLDYRYFRDDWGIDSHTVTLDWYQSLPAGWSVTPTLRYYSQSAADFFAPYFLAPRTDGYYSSDYRLGAFGALSSGLSVAKQFARGARLEAGFEYYMHKASLKLGGSGDGGYADFDAWVAHAALNLDLDGRGSATAGRHAHAHTWGAVPAGVMPGHTLTHAGEWMVGYRYMFASQSGAMQHGTREVSDTTSAQAACGATPCTARPRNMHMHMHMFELMFAPRDWVSLMLMPQAMDMSMDMRPLSPDATAHAGGHDSEGIGDTLFGALLRLFETRAQRAQLGLLWSAPTGATDLTLDGRDAVDSVRQDYGMQIGSGTWDFQPSLTYLGRHDALEWGAQLAAVLRMEARNDAGYALGNLYRVTAWGGYRLSDWLAGSVRLVRTAQEGIEGALSPPSALSAPSDYPRNYGGRTWDLGFGINLGAGTGALAGHGLGVEWLQPIATDHDGYQLARDGTLHVSWHYAF